MTYPHDLLTALPGHHTDPRLTYLQHLLTCFTYLPCQVIVLTHGGPISMPEDAQYVLDRVRGVHGFYGASSMERLPVEVAITEQMHQFKAVTLKK